MGRRVLWIFAAAVLLVVTYSRWLPLLSRPLVRDDGPTKADIAVVLAGDPRGRRILKAAELVRTGYVPNVLVSGPELYGTHESDLAIAYAVRRDCPGEWFISFPNTALSTREEAAQILPELHRRNVRSFLLVTSDYHTARAARIFRSAGLQMRVVPAADPYFSENWWRTREGQKIVFIEWWKTLATAVGM